jgi:hypothetical protein
MKELVKKSDSFVEITRKLDSMMEHRIINCCLTRIISYKQLNEDIFYDVDVERYSKIHNISIGKAMIDLVRFFTEQLKEVVDINTTPYSYIRTTILKEFEVNEASNAIRVKFNKLTIPLISGNMRPKTYSIYNINLDKINNKTQYLLAEYIQSRLWEIRAFGHFYVRISALKSIIGIEADSYTRPSNLLSKVITPTLEALQQLGGIHIEVQKADRNNFKFYRGENENNTGLYHN